MRYFIYLLLALFPIIGNTAPTLIYQNGFEVGDPGVNNETTAGATISYTTNPAFLGSRSLDAQLNYAGGGNNYRAEANLGSANDFNFDQEYWETFVFRLDNWVAGSTADTAFQVHLRPQTWAGCTSGGAASVAPFLMMTSGGDLRFTTYGAVTRWTMPIVQDDWVRITIHFKISMTTAGFIESWVNGVYKGIANGKNHQTNAEGAAACHPWRTPYFKVGIYKWPWKTVTTDPATVRKSQYDDLRIYTGAGTISDIEGGGTPDTTAPTISSVSSNVTSTTANITFTTNESATSSVQYGTTTSYGSTKAGQSGVTSHSVQLTGLSSNTLYHYRIIATDASSNTTTGTDFTFTTAAAADTTDPVISNVIVSGIDTDSATVSWQTDEPASSQVKMSWVADPTGITVSDSALTLNHSVSITGLPEDTVITYLITTIDAAANDATSTSTFSTLSSVPDPAVIFNVVPVIDTGYVKIQWLTDVAGTSKVTVNGLSYKANDGNVTTHSVTTTKPKIGTFTYTVETVDTNANTVTSPTLTYTVVPTIQ